MAKLSKYLCTTFPNFGEIVEKKLAAGSDGMDAINAALEENGLQPHAKNWPHQIAECERKITNQKSGHLLPIKGHKINSK